MALAMSQLARSLDRCDCVNATTADRAFGFAVYSLPNIRSGMKSTISGTKISRIVTTDTAIRNGVDSRA